MNKSYNITLAKTKDELQQILQLQAENNIKNLSEEERKSQGFLTIKHDLALLTEMNDTAQHIIAKDGDKVVGFALVMLKEQGNTIPGLVSMFEIFQKVSYKNKLLSDYNYYVMGQVCVAESHRGTGVFDDLYLKHKEIYSKKFDVLLTEISVKNTRSMAAHQRVGLKPIHTYKDEVQEWNVMIWDWNNE